MKYKIEVHSEGYTDTEYVVYASSLREARCYKRLAKIEWCKANDIDLDSVELPFTRLVKIKT